MIDEEARVLGRLLKAVTVIEGAREFSLLMPEVRVNLVFALADALEPSQVAAVDGRITVVNGMPKAAGLPKFGVSDHMARAIIEIRKYRPDIRAGINFRYDEDVKKTVQEYAKERDLSLGGIERILEPDKEKKGIVKSMPWKIKYLKDVCGQIPDIFYETAGWGKEPLFVVISQDPVSVVNIAADIAKKYYVSVKSRER